jgi:N-acetylneuraminic acid mutarotase
MNYMIKSETLTGIADAIREKKGTSNPVAVNDFASEILSIQGGGAKLNIAYGDTPPEDTSKLWVKTAEAEAVKIKMNVDSVIGKVTAGIAQTTFAPDGVDGMASAVVGTKIYLFGGWCGGANNLDTINVFDTETNSFTTLETKLTKRDHCIAAASVGDRIYLFGGRRDETSDKIIVFDTTNNKLTTLAKTLPEYTDSIAAASVGTKIYLFGGSAVNKSLTATYNLDTIRVFDTTTNELTTLEEKLPRATYGMGISVVGEKIYLVDGKNTQIMVFDTKTNSLTILETTLEKSELCISSIGTKVYMFGGSSGGRRNTIDVFDTKTNSLTTLEEAFLPEIASVGNAVTVGEKIYLFGGTTGSGNTLKLNSVNVFELFFGLATNNMIIESRNTQNVVEIIPNVQIGVNGVYLGNADGHGEKVAAALYKYGEWKEI